MSEHLSIGPAPRPATGEELVARLRAAMVADAPESYRDTIAQLLAGATATVAGDDVPTFDLDATGVRIDGVTGDDSILSGGLPTRELEVTPAAQGSLGVLTVRAHPMHVEGVPVEMGLTLEGLRIQWLDVSDGSVALDVIDPSEAAPLTGHGRVEAPQAELVDAVRRIAEGVAAEQGVELKELDVRLESKDPRTLLLEADARIKKGFLGAPASATATVRIDEALTVHVEDLRITSSNVIVSGLLAAVRGRIEEATREPIDVAGELPPGVRVTDVRIDAGERIGVEVWLG